MSYNESASQPHSDTVKQIFHEVFRGVRNRDIPQHLYDCGYCGTTVSGWVVGTGAPDWGIWWLLCPECGNGSVQNYDKTHPELPPPPSFPNIAGLPDDISSLYTESRISFDAGAYTGSEMLCRKILMKAAVDKSAKTNQKFSYYVDYLGENGYVTSPLKDMAGIIKDNGNDAAHEPDAPDRERAGQTLAFTRRILDTMYGVVHELGKYRNGQAVGSGAS